MSVPADCVSLEPVNALTPVLLTSIVKAPFSTGAVATVTVCPLKSRLAPEFTVSVPFTVALADIVTPPVLLMVRLFKPT